jgi:branched-chain amino acid transport system substrate-binding protein
MRGRLLFTVAFIVILTMVMAPLASAQEPKVFKLGVVADITGVAARTGIEQKNAIDMYFDEIGNKIGDYKIELVSIDTQADADKAARAYEEAIVRDKIQAGLNNFYSSVAIACMDIAAKYKIPHFMGSAESKTIWDKVRGDPVKYGYWLGKTWPIPERLVAPPYLEALTEALPADKHTIAVLSDDGEGPSAVRVAVGETFKAAGWKVVGDEFFGMQETEFYPLISKLKSENPAAVFIVTSAAPTIAAFVKQAREVQLPAMVIAHGLGWIGEWYQLTGNSSDYVLDEIPQWTTDKAKDFVKRYKARFQQDPSPSSAGLAYDYAGVFTMVAKRAIEEYGALTSETLEKVGTQELWTGKISYKDGILMKEYKYSADSYPDAVVGKDAFIFPVIQYSGGVGKIVWPSDWAESKMQFPPAK